MLDSKGFKRRRFDDLFTEIETKAKEVFGQQINTSERSPLGIILRLFAWFLARAWQNSEDVYQSGFVNTAEGVNLDRLGPYGGIKRIQAQAAIGEILITGRPNYFVRSGFRVSSGSTVFETTNDVTLDSTGAAKARIRALVPGRSGNVAGGTITTIINPDANIKAVTNQEGTFGGRDKETDKEFRDRYSLSAEGRGAATIRAIRSGLLRTPGVRAATVVENFMNTPDRAGRNPKSFEAYVLGGTPEAIGQTILDTKAAGIEPWGTQSVIVKDDAGFEHVMKFSYAIEVKVHVLVKVKVDNRFPRDGISQMKSAAIRYIGGEDEDGTLYVGLNMGADVIHQKLMAAMDRVEGITDMTVEIGKDGSNWAKDNLSIAPNEVAQTNHKIIIVSKI
ncbi:baseplate J/gp47 family protein [Paenibacillus tyrfis]|uniref:Baseplate protein J-like barrel domain-containing protein n=1 Tax=Paenibacillus tyrfis TaxID=1501230 RepID=A0A081NWR1_9BACL|nr:baseplate J/gp47 family protein [Paenibacillus tyrfis]KEQ22884.1 hypothetical protein ET33_21305 [Paenibacillus tyrfis]